jgi:uncharacterized delta-60 repeat protein
MAVLRYNPDGTLDTGFGSSSSGVTAVTPIGPGLAGDTCAMLLQNGKIVVVGAAQDGKLVLARYDSAGVLDPTFGTPSTGTTVTTLGATSSNPKHRSPAMTAQSDGRIIVVTRNNDDQAMLRYSADGALDTTFGSGGTGIVITHITGGANYANAVAVQQPGMGVPANLDKIVVAGNAGVTDSTSDISLVRYSKDGALDTSFNSTGIVTTDIFGQFDNGLAVLLQDQPGDEPKILVSGSTGFGSSTQIVVLRYNKDGTADSGFGSRGIGQVFVPVVGPSTIASGNALAIQQGLGIIVTGYD